MNVFVYELARGIIQETPDIGLKKLTVEDNIGEGIHIHFRNIRLDMSIKDFNAFAENIEHGQCSATHVLAVAIFTIKIHGCAEFKVFTKSAIFALSFKECLSFFKRHTFNWCLLI